jgi:hypothetical protein
MYFEKQLYTLHAYFQPDKLFRNGLFNVIDSQLMQGYIISPNKLLKGKIMISNPVFFHG